MKPTQWTAVGLVLLITIGLYAATQDQLFGNHPKKGSGPATDEHAGHDHAEEDLSIDSILYHAKEKLTPEQVTRISFLESSVSRGDVGEQKLHIYHQLSRFWGDTARIFEPYAWYTAEAARLENSEKSLTFAAQNFLNNLRGEESPELKHWKSLQAKDLFERSLKLNPANDSAKIGLGATYLFGAVSDNPMEGISKIREVVEKDSTNVYAQLTLGQASMMSGQMDKAVERFKTVVALDTYNLEASLSLADIYERRGDKAAAVIWYKRSLPLIKENPVLSNEVQKRIKDLTQ